MKIEWRKTGIAEVYTASLNDIMFFLLLFFLIISTMVTPMALKVLLPHSSTAEQVAVKKNIMLVVTGDRQYYIDDQKVGFGEIESRLSAILKNNTTPDGKAVEYVVLLQADKSLNVQDVIDLVDIGNKLHVKTLLFVDKTYRKDFRLYLLQYKYNKILL